MLIYHKIWDQIRILIENRRNKKWDQSNLTRLLKNLMTTKAKW